MCSCFLSVLLAILIVMFHARLYSFSDDLSNEFLHYVITVDIVCTDNELRGDSSTMCCLLPP